MEAKREAVATARPGGSGSHVAKAAVPAAPAVVLPEIEVFEHVDFGGDHWRTSFGYSYVGDDWNDKISSFIIYSGSFQFFEHANFGHSSWSPVTLGPGHYRWVADVGIINDSISSWKAYYG
jgi:hypothetical protein